MLLKRKELAMVKLQLLFKRKGLGIVKSYMLFAGIRKELCRIKSQMLCLKKGLGIVKLHMLFKRTRSGMEKTTHVKIASFFELLSLHVCVHRLSSYKPRTSYPK